MRFITRKLKVIMYYEDEMNNTSEEDKDSIDFRISDNGSAHLSSYDKKYEWTWEVIKL